MRGGGDDDNGDAETLLTREVEPPGGRSRPEADGVIVGCLKRVRVFQPLPNNHDPPLRLVF